jgi:signal transduction histidine kinase/ActR/RegA family two-component response regulator
MSRQAAHMGEIHTMITDLTERVAQEQQRRAIERERDSLAISEQAARQASAAKDQFMAVVSHELRTPLTPVLALVSHLDESPEVPPNLRGVFSRIRKNVELEARLIEDLVDVARIETRKVKILPEIVDLNALIAKAVEDRQEEVTTAGLSLEPHLDATDAFVKGDPIRLRQVLSNLVSNAIKFTERGGKIQVHTENREHGQVTLVVRDTGVGIDPARIPVLFEPFEQAHPGRSQREGLGLGLAICKGLVQAHHGTIEIESRGYNLGTEVRVVLETTEERPERISDIRELLPVQARALRILLVEDHAESANTIAELLRRYGHQVDVAHTVAEALKFDPASLDLLISDIGLPDGSGLEVQLHFAAQHALPAIALSGFGTENDLRSSLEAGFAAHLTKPVSMTDLLETIGRITAAARRKKTRTAAARSPSPPPAE